MSDTANQAQPHFEAALAELEILVESLESGKLPLQEALQTFERGVTLTQQCQTALTQAEQKIQVLTKNTPDAELEPFDRED